MKGWMIGAAFSSVLAGAACIGVTAHAQSADHTGGEKLTAAADVGFAPFAFKQPSGEIAGFSYDFAKEIAKRLGRPGVEIVDVNYSSIFAGLFAKRFELIVAPTNITAERASQMLFSEPYLPTGLGFLTKKGQKIAKLDDLRGKAISVNNGSVSDKWAQENEAKYGFTVQRYNKNADGVQAVMVGRAFANVADLPVSRYIAKQNPMTEIGFVVSTGRDMGLAFRKDDGAFRDKVDGVIECMKKDGTLPAIYEKWFGVKPEPDSSTVKIYPGYGAPDFEGYEATEHALQCG